MMSIGKSVAALVGMAEGAVDGVLVGAADGAPVGALVIEYVIGHVYRGSAMLFVASECQKYFKLAKSTASEHVSV